MERRHFEIIAQAIADLPDYIEKTDKGALRQYVAEHFANHVGPTNAKFKRDRFLKACGVKVTL